MPSQLQTAFSEEFSLATLALQLAVGIALGWILQNFFVRHATVLSNREEFGKVLPKILLTTILIISVVKSSIALSLGLVGALSIVRFRTPIKEPEELAYLFLAIAMGVGIGANQIIFTTLCGGVILLFIFVSSLLRGHEVGQNLYLSVTLPEKLSETDKDDLLSQLGTEISRFTKSTDLRRYELNNDRCEAVYFIAPKDADSIDGIVAALRKKHPGLAVTFIDQNRIMGL